MIDVTLPYMKRNVFCKYLRLKSWGQKYAEIDRTVLQTLNRATLQITQLWLQTDLSESHIRRLVAIVY